MPRPVGEFLRKDEQFSKWQLLVIAAEKFGLSFMKQSVNPGCRHCGLNASVAHFYFKA